MLIKINGVPIIPNYASIIGNQKPSLKLLALQLLLSRMSNGWYQDYLHARTPDGILMNVVLAGDVMPRLA